MDREIQALSELTKNQYERRFSSLMKRFSNLSGLSMPDNMPQFLEWIDHQAYTLSNSTRRQYRSAIKYGVRYLNIDFDEQFPDFLKSNRTQSHIRKTYGKRTSALKSKLIKPATLAALIDYLEASTSDSANLIKDMLIASSYFGLRPIEWNDATWVIKDSSQPGLLVQNAKHSHGRSHGEKRTIWIAKHETEKATADAKNAIIAAHRLISLFKEVKIHAVLTFTQTASADQYEYTKTLTRLERDACEARITKARHFLSQLYRTNPRFKRLAQTNRITLYSARHQFAANAKKAELVPEEIAALMGHGSAETNQESYGRRTSGIPGCFGVEADEQDIKNVLEHPANQSESLSVKNYSNA